MSWTIEEVLSDESIERVEPCLGGYVFQLKHIPTKITVLLTANSNGGYDFKLSHAIHTPTQLGPYHPSRPWGDDEAYALHLAVNSITNYYRDALKAGNTPSQDWLIPTPDEFSETEIDEWFELEEAEPEAITEQVDIVQRYTDAQLRIVRTTMDLSLHNLRESLKDSNYINLSPGYQRRHRWDIRQKSQLIESLLLNIPIPPIFLFENDYNQYEIMDGRQRLEAVKGFLDNSYPLRGIEYWPELDGSRFNDLPPTIQRGLLRRTVTAIVLLAETSRPGDSEIDVRMALFKRLNTGGIKLNHQELRNALYPSEFNSMLFDLAQLDTFRDTWGIPRFTKEEKEIIPKKLQANALYKTMADCELVLRFFAIKETIIEKQRGSLKNLMDKTVKRHLKSDAVQVAAMKQEFIEILQFYYQAFGGRPFVLPKTNRPSRPAYDALMVAAAIVGVCNLVGKEKEINTSFEKAASDPNNYEILVGRGNTVEAIKERVTLAQNIINL